MIDLLIFSGTFAEAVPDSGGVERWLEDDDVQRKVHKKAICFCPVDKIMIQCNSRFLPAAKPRRSIMAK